MSEKQPSGQGSECWAAEMGEKWNAHIDRFEAMIAPIGDALIETAAFRPGERVIDIGCGGGATSLAIARAVGGAGSVTGLDIAPVLVRLATSRASQADFKNARFILGDAASATLDEAGFDCLFSRFGVMFFDDPYAAFAHMRGFVRPGGRIAFACWGPPEENPWITSLMGLVRRYVELPPAPPRAPGPLAFGDADYVRDILGKAGFSGVALNPWRGTQYLGGRGLNAKSAAAFLKDALFVGEALQSTPKDVQDRALVEIEAFLARHQTAEGVGLPAMAWLVTGKA